MTMTWLILVGIVAGAGLAVMIAELRPAPPELGAALDRLHQRPGTSGEHGWSEEPVSALDRVGGRLLGLSFATVPRQELLLVGRTPARFMFHKLAFAVLGLLAAPYLQLMLTMTGLSVSVVIPAVGSLGVAALCWFIPDLVVRGEAKEARTDYLHAIAAYLELVALERAADCGPAEALLRAAKVGRGRAFQQLEAVLDRSALERRPPWDGLTEMASELGLTPLQDLSDTMRMSGDDGAAVYRTLRARAENLRAELLSAELAKSNVVSEKMVVPGVALVMIMTMLIAFPAVYRMFTNA
ncbi:hypothetical protein ABIA32_003176 [Streptacidiphilus sp. MAP12-20]|uniref:type II secretion system F family protein n=1 Tax=Streptacidiphilus sp. MAP12-20 TaxID=3156299 RepID=UPI003519A8C7